MPRELSDETLLQQLAGFVNYRTQGGRMSLAEWADVRGFVASDQDFLKAAHLGLTVLPVLRRWQ